MAIDSYANAIAGIESGGKYGILGPVTKSGDRAYGKFQVMGQNVGPWTEQYYGQRLSPQEYLNNPQAQDAVFQGVFGKYVEKYGPEGAAKAWFAGEKGMNNPNAKDILGTTVDAYGRKFMAGLGQPDQPAAPIVQPAAPMPQQAPMAAPQPSFAGMAPPAQSAPQGGLLPVSTQAPPELADLASLLQPFQLKAPKRGLLPFRG